ncbi:MAG: glycosyltransferase [Actinobacteria bacterium]|nr:glycosyltransferase [Actinomycetota bacterium]
MRDKLKASVIVTVYNEAQSIEALLRSLLDQTRPPDEIVVVDGGSTDGTLDLLRGFSAPRLVVREAPGANISQGRNLAIKAASHDIIACTDAGVRLEPDWLAQLTAPFASQSPPDVVCGFFAPDPQSAFERAMGATVLPEWGDADPARFLPSSRSVAFTKDAWQRAGGYPEWLDYCEDVVFDLQLRRAGLRFGHAPQALARFRPRSTLRAFVRQYYQYARGDGKADLYLKRHLIRYATYTLAPIALIAGFWYNLIWLGLLLAAAAYLYGPYRQLSRWLGGLSLADKLLAALWVPVIRLVGDAAKMAGYPVGYRWRRRHRPPAWNRQSA